MGRFQHKKDFNYSNDVALKPEAVDSFSRISSRCMYVVDCVNDKIVYASGDWEYWFGKDAKTVVDSGMSMLSYIKDEDLKLLDEAYRDLQELKKNNPMLEWGKSGMSMNFMILHNGNYVLTNHHVTPYQYDDNGQLRFLLCNFCESAIQDSGAFILKFKGDNLNFYEYSASKHKWVRHSKALLTHRECDVIALSSQGYTTEEIAKKIFWSRDTIKKDKLSIFSKLGVSNMPQAIAYMSNHLLF